MATTFRPDDDDRARAIARELVDLAAVAGTPRRPIAVRVGERGSRVRFGRVVEIDPGDLEQPWTTGTIAHELGHLVDPAGRRTRLAFATLMLVPAAMLAALVTLAAPWNGTPPSFGILSLASWGMAATILGLFAISRRAEYRVDAIASDMLGDDASLHAMFEHLATLGDRPPDWLCTHPSPQRRAAAVRRHRAR